MKKLILSLFLLMAAVSLGAQTNYYPGDSGTIARNGYTYKYVNDGGGYMRVYNIENRFIDAKQSQRDGSLIPGDGRIPGFEDDGGWSYQRSVAIVQEAMNTLKHRYRLTPTEAAEPTCSNGRIVEAGDSGISNRRIRLKRISRGTLQGIRRRPFCYIRVCRKQLYKRY